jgi:hypothetical protein
MRIGSISCIVVLTFLVLPGPAFAQQFNPSCGLLGALAQYRQHNAFCRTSEQVIKTNVVPRTPQQRKCAPTTTAGLAGNNEGGNTTGLGAALGRAIGDAF